MPKVFLSPSNQYDNLYAYGDTTEGVQCGKIAEACKVALERSRVQVKLMHDEPMQEKVAASNAFDADLHVPIHTNAFNGTVSGTRMFCFNDSGNGMRACKAIFNRLAPITPGTSENIRVNASLYEVKVPTAPTAYIEVDFHDVPEVAKWIIGNTELIGETIARGICDYLGVAFKEASKTIYRVQVGAYAVKANADKMLAKLKNDGYDGFIVEGTL
nr:MAG TPA: Cell wall hydrolase autolysin [Caudoviricetes sp.]